jgi:hypothetical protein
VCVCVWRQAEIQSWMIANLMAAGIAAIILAFVILGTIGAAVIVYRSSLIMQKKLALNNAAKRMDVSGARVRPGAQCLVLWRPS